MGGVEILAAYGISRVKCQQIFYVYLSLFTDGGKMWWWGGTAGVIPKRKEACLYHLVQCLPKCIRKQFNTKNVMALVVGVRCKI